MVSNIERMKVLQKGWRNFSLVASADLNYILLETDIFVINLV